MTAAIGLRRLSELWRAKAIRKQKPIRVFDKAQDAGMVGVPNRL